MAVEQPMPGMTYRVAIDPFCEAQECRHGARPAVHGQLVRLLWMEPDGQYGHVYACKLLSGSEEPTGFVVNGRPVSVRGSKQFFSPSELMERDWPAEIAALAKEKP